MGTPYGAKEGGRGLKLYSSAFHVSPHLAVLAFLAEKLLQRPLASLTLLGTRREGQEAGRGDFRCPSSPMEEEQGQGGLQEEKQVTAVSAEAMLPPSGEFWQPRTGAKLHSSLVVKVLPRALDDRILDRTFVPHFPPKITSKTAKDGELKFLNIPASGGRGGGGTQGGTRMGKRGGGPKWGNGGT